MRLDGLEVCQELPEDVVYGIHKPDDVGKGRMYGFYGYTFRRLSPIKYTVLTIVDERVLEARRQPSQWGYQAL